MEILFVRAVLNSRTDNIAQSMSDIDSRASIILDIQYIPGLNQRRTVYTDDLIWISSLILSPSNPITIFK